MCIVAIATCTAIASTSSPQALAVGAAAVLSEGRTCVTPSSTLVHCAVTALSSELSSVTVVCSERLSARPSSAQRSHVAVAACAQQHHVQA
eukprot:3976-Heterococcus_DN1.PRE.2